MADFTANGTFVPPTGLTQVFVQVWGAGGGGGAVALGLPLGGGGGAGGFAWCSVPVQPGTAYTVTVGQGGAGAPLIGQDGTTGASSTLVGPGGALASATGGAGGHAGLLTSPPSPGGTGTCSLPARGTTRDGAPGLAPVSLTGPPGQGGKPAVSGIVEPAPTGAAVGGNGGTTGAIAAPNGGNGYVVIWW